MDNCIHIGIDAGGTLIKTAVSDKGSIRLRTFPANQLQGVAQWIEETYPHAEICVTGGKAQQLQQRINGDIKQIVEFDATCRGVEYLCSEKPQLQQPYILTNVGTGTSIHIINKQIQRRIGGTGVGGGTLVGLSYLLTGIRDYRQIVQLASQGQRAEIDLTVARIYEGAVPPIPGNLTASNFGYPQLQQDHRKEDLLAAVVGMVGETVSTTSVLAADRFEAPVVVYIGSSFLDNPLLRKVVEDYTRLRGAEPLFVENGEYSGAIGALLSLAE